MLQNNLTNINKFQKELNHYDRVEKTIEVERALATKSSIEMTEENESPSQPKFYYLPDIEARKSRLSRLNKLNLLS